jgi:hypothetical protein
VHKGISAQGEKAKVKSMDKAVSFSTPELAAFFIYPCGSGNKYQFFCIFPSNFAIITPPKDTRRPNETKTYSNYRT